MKSRESVRAQFIHYFCAAEKKKKNTAKARGRILSISPDPGQIGRCFGLFEAIHRTFVLWAKHEINTFSASLGAANVLHCESEPNRRSAEWSILRILI